MGESMLAISNISLGYQGNIILRLPDISLVRGSQSLIVGQSGSGKTTLLYSIAGLLDVIEGNIIINDTDITTLTESARDHFRSKHIGIIFQTLHLIKSLSVLENLLLSPYVANLPQHKERALELLEKLGIADKAHQLPAALSQGQAQRVAIARSVLNHPELLLADEPTSSLDDSSCEAVITLLKQVAQENNSTLIIATHDNRVKAHFNNIIQVGKCA
jgi:putative ABC transport system ATP-binding protein